MTGIDLDEVARAHATQSQHGSLKYLLLSSLLTSAVQFGVFAGIIRDGGVYFGLLFLLCFLLGCFLIGFFQGHMADVNRRKRTLLTVTLLNTALCHLMQQIGWEDLLLLMGVLMGVLAGLVRTFSIALVIDVVPSEDRGKCIPLYYTALLLGWILSAVMLILGIGRESLVYVSLLGLLALLPANVRFRAPIQSPVLSLDRFFLLKGIPAFVAALPLFASVPLMLGLYWLSSWWMLLVPVLLYGILMGTFFLMLHITEHCRRSTTAMSCLLCMDAGVALGVALAVHPTLEAHQHTIVICLVAFSLLMAVPLRYYLRHHKKR